MKRLVATLAVIGAAGFATLATAGTAQADGLCLSYDIHVNGQGQSGTQCLPPSGTPSLPGLSL
ncbi:MAG: hypothetical protein ACTHOK_07705 [Nocardioidaceae bacterium]